MFTVGITTRRLTL